MEANREEIAKKLAEIDGVAWDLPDIKGRGKYLNVPREEYRNKAKQIFVLLTAQVEQVKAEAYEQGMMAMQDKIVKTRGAPLDKLLSGVKREVAEEICSLLYDLLNTNSNSPDAIPVKLKHIISGIEKHYTSNLSG